MLYTKGYLVNILNTRLCSHYFGAQHSNYSPYSEFTYWSGSLLKGHNFQSFIPIAIKASF